jgi:hypothetical protein
VTHIPKIRRYDNQSTIALPRWLLSLKYSSAGATRNLAGESLTIRAELRTSDLFDLTDRQLDMFISRTPVHKHPTTPDSPFHDLVVRKQRLAVFGVEKGSQ